MQKIHNFKSTNISENKKKALENFFTNFFTFLFTAFGGALVSALATQESFA